MLRSRSSRLLLAFSGTLIASCAGERSLSDNAVSEWFSEASLTIGADTEDDSATIFEQITGATKLPNGDLLIADLGDAPLRRFGADGRLIRRVARRGTGPGEMEYLARLYRCGDAIYTYDIAGYRIQQFDTGANYQRVFRFQGPTGQSVPYVTACNAEGRFASVGWGAQGVPTAGYHRDTAAVWVTATPDGEATIVDSVPASERWGQTANGRIVGSAPLPMGKQPRIAFGPKAFYIATGDAPEVRVYDALGVRRGTYSLRDSIPSLTPDDVRDYVERQVIAAGERRRASIEREYAAISFPERPPAVTALTVDSEGLLWMRPYAPASDSLVRWRVLDDAGREVAAVELPRALDIFEIGRDYILGREPERAEGVPVVRMFTLRRGR